MIAASLAYIIIITSLFFTRFVVYRVDAIKGTECRPRLLLRLLQFQTFEGKIGDMQTVQAIVPMHLSI